jgi:tetratricopeptide (TPR) repeat protein
MTLPGARSASVFSPQAYAPALTTPAKPTTVNPPPPLPLPPVPVARTEGLSEETRAEIRTAATRAYQKAQGGDPVGGASDLSRLIQQYPMADLAYAQRAAVFMLTGNNDAALSDARRAQAIDPEQAQYAALVGQALNRLKRYAEAGKVASAALTPRSSASDRARLNYVSACAALGQGQVQQALVSFDVAFNANTENLTWMCNLSEIREIAGGLERAKRDEFDQALSARGTSPMARIIKGYLSPDKRLAIAQYDEAVRISPEWMSARRQRLSANMELNAYAAALEDLNWLAEKTPNDDALFMLRGAVRSAMGNSAGAIADYTKAIQLAPRGAGAYKNRCRERATAKTDLQGALEDCNQAVTLTPNDWAAYDNRGLVYLQMAKPANAVADFDTALALSNNSWSHYGRALARKALGDDQGARTDADAAVQLKSDIKTVYPNVGVTL